METMLEALGVSKKVSVRGMEKSDFAIMPMAKLEYARRPFSLSLLDGIGKNYFDMDKRIIGGITINAGAQFLSDLGFYPWSREDLARRTAALPGIIEKNLGAPKGSFSFLENSDLS